MAEQLRDRGFDVLSAGVAAVDGCPASPEAVEVLRAQGINITDHLSRQVTTEMLEQSDVVLTMTPRHLQMLVDAKPELASRMRTLRSDGQGISDPIGAGIDEYRRCAQEITDCVEQVLDDLLTPDEPQADSR